MLLPMSSLHTNSSSEKKAPKKEKSAKEKRQDKVLRVVENFIRTEGAVNFSMKELADQAGVSFATPFNLFGSKEEILIALFNQRVAIQAQQSAARAELLSPVDNLMRIAQDSANRYLSDGELFRPLVQAFRIVGTSRGHSAAREAVNIWADAVKRCVADGTARSNTPIEKTARHMHLAFRATFWMWGNEQMTDEDFREQAKYATAAAFLPWATPEGRAALLRLLDTSTSA